MDHRRRDHTNAITAGNTKNALVCHMRANPGHTFDLDSASLVYISNMERKRQLVESSIIATTANCNIRRGDFPVCKLTAPVVIQTLNLSSKLAPSTRPPAPGTPSPSQQSISSNHSQLAAAAPVPPLPVISAPHVVHPLTPAPSPAGPPAARTRQGRARNTLLFHKNRSAPYDHLGPRSDGSPANRNASGSHIVPDSHTSLPNSQPSATSSSMLSSCSRSTFPSSSAPAILPVPPK